MILWLRFLDWFESKWRRFWKVRKFSKKFGVRWEDYERSGRKYSRVDFFKYCDMSVVDRIAPDGADVFVTEPRHVIRPEPGWEWTCQNCKTYSFIRESDMPEILKEWDIMRANAIKRGYKIPIKPTPATAGCTNCRFRPGSPE